MVVSLEIDLLSQVEAVQHFSEFSGCCGVRGVKVYVERVWRVREDKAGSQSHEGTMGLA